MNTTTPQSQRCTSFCSLSTVVAGGLVLLGWTFQIDVLTRVLPQFVAMNPLSAVCFILSGTSLFLQRKPNTHSRSLWLARGLALTVIALSLTKFFDQLRIKAVALDTWLFADSIGNNQMPLNTAFCFLLSGICLLSMDWIVAKRRWPAQFPALLLAMISMIALLGYAYGRAEMYEVRSSPMTILSATLFLVLSFGILVSRPGRGVISVVLHDGPGGIVARRLIPFGIALPCLLGWIRVMGQRSEFYETEFGAALMVAVTAIIFAIAICAIASTLNKTDEQRLQGILDLARSAQEIRELYDNAPCGYHSLNSEGFIIAINNTELSWLGRERQEVVGKIRFADLISSSDRNSFVTQFNEFQKSGRFKEMTFEILRKEGEPLPVTLNATAVYDEDGNLVSCRSTLTDATERRRVENTYRSFNAELENRVEERTAELNLLNAELRDKNQENEMFVYSVSHDLRSPLVNLQGFSQELSLVSQQLRKLLNQGDVPESIEHQSAQLIDDEMGRCIRFIQTSVGRLSGIIDALLRLSRAGRIEHDPKLVDLDQLVGRVVDAMSSVIFDRGVKIDIDPLPATWGDPTALEQIFANLIGNAVNYLDPDRPGGIKVGCLPAESDATSTTYYVRDNGLGIPEAYHAKVFQALKRLHPKVAQGEGVGLALVKRMVERHGGTIWFESTERAGSTFYVKLPNATLQELVTEVITDSPIDLGSDHENQTFEYSVSGR